MHANNFFSNLLSKRQNSYSAVNLVDSNLDDSPIPEYAHFARDLESDSTVPDVTVQDMVLANSDPIIVPSQVDDQQWSLLQTALQVSPSGCSRFGGDSPCGQHSDCSSSCYGSSPAASPLPQATETMESSCSGSDEEEPRRTTAKKSGKKPVKMPQSKLNLWAKIVLFICGMLIKKIADSNGMHTSIIIIIVIGRKIVFLILSLTGMHL